MPYEGPGNKHTVAACARAHAHGAAAFEDNHAGMIEKVVQLDAFVDPSTTAATQIAIGEEAEMTVTGIIEVPRTGNLAAAAVGNDVYIRGTDDVLGLAAQALGAGSVLNANWHKLGKIDELDTTRAVGICRVNLNLVGQVAGNNP